MFILLHLLLTLEFLFNLCLKLHKLLYFKFLFHLFLLGIQDITVRDGCILVICRLLYYAFNLLHIITILWCISDCKPQECHQLEWKNVPILSSGHCYVHHYSGHTAVQPIHRFKIMTSKYWMWVLLSALPCLHSWDTIYWIALRGLGLHDEKRKEGQATQPCVREHIMQRPANVHAPPAGMNQGKNQSRSESLKETTAAAGAREPHKTPPDTETLNSIHSSPSDSLHSPPSPPPLHAIALVCLSLSPGSAVSCRVGQLHVSHIFQTAVKYQASPSLSPLSNLMSPRSLLFSHSSPLLLWFSSTGCRIQLSEPRSFISALLVLMSSTADLTNISDGLGDAVVRCLTKCRPQKSFQRLKLTLCGFHRLPYRTIIIL